ncbi:MAG: hypothetical protein KF691_14060 [Phycisphaeraceae bacterium]|nr:hypothetical protein [Phycisphaeraceae bacterium]
MERPISIAAHARTTAIFLFAGLISTIALCTFAAVTNIATPLRPPPQTGAYQPQTFTYAVPDFGKSTAKQFSPAVSQTWSSGITSWTVSDDQSGAAQEFGQSLVGPCRTHLLAQAPFLYNRPVGTKIDGMWQRIRCGFRSTQSCEWRWYGMGWPFIAFRCEAARIQTYQWDDGRPSLPAKIVDDWMRVAGGFSVPKKCLWPNSNVLPALYKVTVIPYSPAMAGLAGNMFFFGAAWFLLLRGRRTVRDLRAWARERNTRCRACGYSLVGLTGPVCPECGASAAGARS